MARQLGLKTMYEMVINVTKVRNQTEELHTKTYLVPLTDMDGKLWETEVGCAKEEICSLVKKVKLSETIKTLEVESLDIKRPEGKLELLIGLDYATLLPQVVKSVENLQLCRNVFGYCTRGSHHSFQGVSDRILTVQISHARMRYDLN